MKIKFISKTKIFILPSKTTKDQIIFAMSLYFMNHPFAAVDINFWSTSGWPPSFFSNYIGLGLFPYSFLLFSIDRSLMLQKN